MEVNQIPADWQTTLLTCLVAYWPSSSSSLSQMLHICHVRENTPGLVLFWAKLLAQCECRWFSGFLTYTLKLCSIIKQECWFSQNLNFVGPSHITKPVETLICVLWKPWHARQLLKRCWNRLNPAHSFCMLRCLGDRTSIALIHQHSSTPVADIWQRCSMLCMTRFEGVHLRNPVCGSNYQHDVDCL